MGIYLGDKKLSSTQEELSAETTARQQADNNLNGLIENETGERRMADDELAYQLAGKFDSAEQSSNTLILNKNGTEAFRYEPTVPSVMQFKGVTYQVSLPTTGQNIGDYWVLQDTEGPYVGKSAIWNGLYWAYTGTTITIDQTVQESSTTAVSGGAVFNHTKTLVQTIYDIVFPVRTRHIGFTAPVIPAGVEATWEIDTLYNGKYLYIDSTKAAGTLVDEAATVSSTAITIDQMPSHTHDRGSMNITGYLAVAPSGGSVDSLPIKLASGPFYDAGNYGPINKKITDINSRYDRAGVGAAIGFDASKNWTGSTSSTGSNKGHNHSVSGIKVKGVTIQVWKRTA